MDVQILGPVQEDEIARIEAAISAQLPAEYREWLLKSGGGKVHDLAMPAPGGTGILLEFLSLDDIIDSYGDGFQAMLPKRCVEVGGGAGGGVVISTSGDDVGFIYWADYDKGLQLGLVDEFDEVSETTDDILIPLADSWNDFLDSDR